MRTRIIKIFFFQHIMTAQKTSAQFLPLQQTYYTTYSYLLNIAMCHSLFVYYFPFISLLIFNQAAQRTVYGLLLSSFTASSTIWLQSWS